ncbi:bifunctional tetrahydrofolate synthase/dihydrofolate synthase [Sinimarinibacterium sp. CAU 1509]|nr:bifunctional tetrahydrofolate synthase/dihydrofolate synthase [Sinimarinibacterium sp. CAU 1509]
MGAGSSLEDWLRWQETLHPRSIELGLGRIARVAAALRLPAHDALTITIAGTNGKGSSAHLAELIYRKAGYHVGLYTSPHLLHYNERIRIDGEPCRDADLCRAFTAIEAARGNVALTYFEFGTLAALWLFREAGVQLQILEVGLGGRLDATNLVDADAALVTTIGLDHQDWLGDTREQIAVEKAGVFRHGRVAIAAEPAPPATLIAEATRIGALLQRRGQDFDVGRGENGFDWIGTDREYAGLPLPGIAGDAQIDNAAGVIALVEALQARLPVPESALRSALPQLRVPGRLTQRGDLLLDVAHNAEAAQVLAQAIERLYDETGVVLVLGMLDDKPHAAFVAALATRLNAVVFVDLPPPRGLKAEDLQARVQASLTADMPQRCCDNMRDALNQARSFAGGAGHIVVTGSFLTVAEALSTVDG